MAPLGPITPSYPATASAFIFNNEGNIHTIYIDIKGIPTIGIGFALITKSRTGKYERSDNVEKLKDLCGEDTQLYKQIVSVADFAVDGMNKFNSDSVNIAMSLKEFRDTALYRFYKENIGELIYSQGDSDNKMSSKFSSIMVDGFVSTPARISDSISKAMINRLLPDLAKSLSSTLGNLYNNADDSLKNLFLDIGYQHGPSSSMVQTLRTYINKGEYGLAVSKISGDKDSSAERNEWRIDLLTQYFGNHSELLHLGTLGNVTYLGSKISLSSNGTNVVIVRSYSDGIESKGITTTIPLADREPNFTGPVFKERTISVVQSEDGTHEIYTIMTTDGYERRKMTYSVPVRGGAITNIRESTEKMDSNSSLNWLLDQGRYLRTSTGNLGNIGSSAVISASNSYFTENLLRLSNSSQSSSNSITGLDTGLNFGSGSIIGAFYEVVTPVAGGAGAGSIAARTPVVLSSGNQTMTVAQLTALDGNRDGKLARNEVSGLNFWVDANENGLAESGEITAVSASKIIASDQYKILTAGNGRFADTSASPAPAGLGSLVRTVPSSNYASLRNSSQVFNFVKNGAWGSFTAQASDPYIVSNGGGAPTTIVGNNTGDNFWSGIYSGYANYFSSDSIVTLIGGNGSAILYGDFCEQNYGSDQDNHFVKYRIAA